MCGLFGIVGGRDVSAMIVESLSRLSYRGNDAAGIAVLDDSAERIIQCVKAQGEVVNLRNKLTNEIVRGNIGIGHTRWATHGAATELNAQPHTTALVAVAHNGIVDNFRYIKKHLINNGITLKTDTDSEVIPCLITYYIENLGLSNRDALRRAMSDLDGSMSIVALFAGGNVVMAARKNAHTSLILGYGEDCMFASSDIYAMSQWTNKISYLENEDIAVLSNSSVDVYDKSDCSVLRQIKAAPDIENDADKGSFIHFMLKEIHEQPKTFSDTLDEYYNRASGAISIHPEMVSAMLNADLIRLVGCGSAYYACQIGKWYIENIASVRVVAEIASEFRYNGGFLSPDDLTLCVSQSGETADTIAAINYAAKAGNVTVGIVNAPGTYLARGVDFVCPTVVGREVSVATTKAFTAQLAVFCCIAAALLREKNDTIGGVARNAMDDMACIPQNMRLLLSGQEQFTEAARIISSADSALYVGRGVYYSVASEGALKLREVAYIHAEAIAAGELKHGSIALVDNKMPVVAICPSKDNAAFSKMLASIQEVKARLGIVVALTDFSGFEILDSENLCDHIIVIPECGNFAAPVLYSVAVQLLAYYSGIFRGTDIDKPRNLAKSVTVE